MLKQYVETMFSLDSIALQRVAYINESQSHLLSSEEKQSLLLQAEACGKSMASSLKQKYGDCNIEKLITECGGKINKMYELPDSDYTLFAFFELPNNITINMANIEKTEEIIKGNDLETLIGKVSVRDVLLCHELYHLLESQNGNDSFIKQKHACAFSLGKFKLMRRVNCLEEIAAMAFASELMKITFSPYVFNIIMLYAFHPEQSAKVMADYISKEGQL